MADGFQAWWDSQPFLTKWMMAFSLVLTLSANFGLLSPYSLILQPAVLIYKQFQLWRLFTGFFYFGGLGFPFLIQMIFLQKYSSQLETTVFAGRTGDYLFMLLFGAVLFLAVGFWLKLAILGEGLIFMLLYYWSRRNPEVIMSFFFGFQFKGIYLPWVLIGFHTLLSGSLPLIEIIGVIVGHVYFFLSDVYPATTGTNWLRTPAFLYRLFPPQFNRYAPGAQQQRYQQQQARGPQEYRHDWGRGHVLGGGQQ